MTHSSSGAACGAISSTNAGRVALRRRAGSSAEPFLQPHVVQPQRVRDRIYAVLPGQFDRSLPQRLRQLRPPRLGAAKLIQLALQLHDWLGDGWCAFAVHDQPPFGD